MKASKYPRVGEIVRSRRGLCKLCGQPKSDTAIVVQVDWLRGDDEVFPVHAECIKGKKSHELLQLLIETGTSRKGLARPVRGRPDLKKGQDPCQHPL